MKKFYKVEVRNRFDDDRVTGVKYFTTMARALVYATRINDEYNMRKALGDYGRMVYHVDIDSGIETLIADEDEGT